jgi:hypothetical protein
MPKRLREATLAEPVARHLRRRRFRVLLMEAPFFDRQIDIFGFCASDDTTVAIELKLTKWQRALDQALIYQLCADFSFVAMPQAAVQSVDLDLFAEHGIGVIAVSNSKRCKVILPAAHSRVVRGHYRRELLQLLKEFA